MGGSDGSDGSGGRKMIAGGSAGGSAGGGSNGGGCECGISAKSLVLDVDVIVMRF